MTPETTFEEEKPVITSLGWLIARCIETGESQVVHVRNIMDNSGITEARLQYRESTARVLQNSPEAQNLIPGKRE